VHSGCGCKPAATRKVLVLEAVGDGYSGKVLIAAGH
jgi:hypothetical protein